MFQTVVTQTRVQCCECGMEFYMPDSFVKMRRGDGKLFYCPAGHSQYYTEKENELANLKKQNQSLQTRLSWSENAARNANQSWEAERRSHAATKGKLTKTRKRIANGVCPCCHRTFVQLQRHMSSKHPQFKEVVS